jgi:hypothetical protein
MAARERWNLYLPRGVRKHRPRLLLSSLPGNVASREKKKSRSSQWSWMWLKIVKKPRTQVNNSYRDHLISFDHGRSRARAFKFENPFFASSSRRSTKTPREEQKGKKGGFDRQEETSHQNDIEEMSESELRLNRLTKVEAMRESGVEPFFALRRKIGRRRRRRKRQRVGRRTCHDSSSIWKDGLFHTTGRDWNYPVTIWHEPPWGFM